MAQLWGEWEPRFYQSGTCIVGQRHDAKKPWLYVYGDVCVNENTTDRNRMRMCHELAEFMNGGQRPRWLDDLHRNSEINATALAGASITATGPMIDKDPPNLHWVQDESPEAASDRAKLMDAIFNLLEIERA